MTLDIIIVTPAVTEEERQGRASAAWDVLMKEAYLLYRRGLLPPRMSGLVPDVTSVTLGESKSPSVNDNDDRLYGRVDW